MYVLKKRMEEINAPIIVDKSGKNNPRYINVNTKKILEMYKNNNSISQISKKLNITRSIIYNRLKNPEKYL